jgi:hypothetical protein
MSLVERNQPIQALAGHRPDHAFAEGVRHRENQLPPDAGGVTATEHCHLRVVGSIPTRLTCYSAFSASTGSTAAARRAGT